MSNNAVSTWLRKEGISVVVPVYNSADSLPILIDRLIPVLETTGAPYEILLVDDDSRDDSWRIITELTRQSSYVRGINLARNYGQHCALLCGLRSARWGVTITLDDDLQNPPEEIPLLLAKLQEGHDVVYGTPSVERHGLLRDLASRMTKIALQGVMGAEVARSVSAFRAFRTVLREAFWRYEAPYVSIDVLLTWGTRRFASVKVRHDPRPLGRSNYTFRKLATHAMNMVTGFTVLPLQVTSGVGFGFTLFGFLVLMFVVGRYLWQGTTVPGFPFLASVIAIFSGAQLFALGIVGEYLARIHLRTMGCPAYTVREKAERETLGDRETAGICRSERRVTESVVAEGRNLQAHGSSSPRRRRPRA